MIPNQNLDLDYLKNKAEELQRMLDGSGDDLNYEEVMNEFGVDLKSLEDEFANYKPKLDLGYVKLKEDAVEPKYNYESDSGFDLHSIEEIVLPPFGRALVPTGLSFDIKDGYEIQVRTKSGLAINQGLMVLNSPGTVDNGYNGEIKVIVMNMNNSNLTINKGQKVAQAVLCPVVNGGWVSLVKQNKIKEKDRNDKGFGSTGI